MSFRKMLVSLLLVAGLLVLPSITEAGPIRAAGRGVAAAGRVAGRGAAKAGRGMARAATHPLGGAMRR